jgi:phospho-N-acetylmuramoyl-pentapeptide-transferase
LAGTSAVSVLAGNFTFVSGNIFFQLFDIMYIGDFIAAFVGSLIGFLWYNSYPASVLWVIQGLTIGGIIAVWQLLSELILYCADFLVENLSVVLQVSYFKYTKKRFGEEEYF